MAKKMKYGIPNNVAIDERVSPNFRRDMRRTSEVDESRDPTNRKPYRTKAQKAQARAAVKRRKGAFFAATPRTYHPDRLDANGKLKQGGQ